MTSTETTTYTYDTFGRCNSVSSAGRSETLDYDELGRVKSKLAADGTKTEMTYDDAGQVSKVIRNGKVTTEIVRDEFHRVIGEKDALSRLSRSEHDVRGNLLTQIAANGSTTRYEYDVSNRRTAQIDGNGNKIAFAYDPAGHLIQQINPLGGTQTWKYDSKTGKLLERSNGEQVILHTYDKDGSLLSIDYGSDQKITYTYDKQGRPLTATSPDSLFETSYDPQSRPTATRAASGADEYLLSYRYNRRGQRSGLLVSKLENSKYLALQQTEQVYDEAGNLVSILTNGITAISYRYDLAGRPILKTYGTAQPGKPALTAAISYDSSGHLSQIIFQGGKLSSPLSLIYAWDDADQLTRRTWNGKSLHYSYDRSGQLLQVFDEQTSTVTEAYSYDKAGNMLTKQINGQVTAMTYNSANQLNKSYNLGPSLNLPTTALPTTDVGLEKISKSSLTYSYDHAGRLLGTDSNRLNTYGWLDKLLSLNLPDGSKATHNYWPDGQLASITTMSPPTSPIVRYSTETFLWDGLALIQRDNTSYIIESHPSGGIPIASHPIGKPEEITYHLNDLLGTTLATVGPGGVQFSALTSFGQPLKASINHTPLSNEAPTAPSNPVPNSTQLPPTRP